MPRRSPKRDLVRSGEYKHYAVSIQVHERSGEDPSVYSDQSVAAKSPESAIRKAGMRLVQQLIRKSNEP